MLSLARGVFQHWWLVVRVRHDGEGLPRVDASVTWALVGAGVALAFLDTLVCGQDPLWLVAATMIATLALIRYTYPDLLGMVGIVLAVSALIGIGVFLLTGFPYGSLLASIVAAPGMVRLFALHA